MCTLVECLLPHLENHLCGFQCWFKAYLLDETASMAIEDSGNADRVDPGCLPSGMSSFLGHVQAYGSASPKQNTDLAYYCSNQSVEIAIHSYRVDEGPVSDICCHTSRLARASMGIRLLKQCQYLSTVLWYVPSVEVISI